MSNRLGVVIVVATMSAAPSLFAQRTVQVSNKHLSIPTTVAGAEAEGAAFPRGPKPEHVPGIFRRPPSPVRKCVGIAMPDYVHQPAELRSGDFVMGGRVGPGNPPVAGTPAKIWWIPYHNPFDYKTQLLVRGARLGSTTDTVRYEQADYAMPGKPGIGKQSPGSESFFASGLTLPTKGTWLLVATAGDDWGCFLIKAT